jgi:sarcosine oxidase subunit beta
VVTAIDVVGGRVVGVTTSGGSIAADVVVLTAGVHTGQLCAPLGLNLPILVRRVGVVQTTPLPPMLNQVLGVAAADFAGRQEVSGRFRFTGGGEPWPHDLGQDDANDESMQPRIADIASSLAKAVAVVPALTDARISRVWGGLLDMTPDALPIIERVSEIDGLIVAAGFSGHGFCLGPVTGEIVSQLALRDSTAYPIEPFRLNRFAERLRTDQVTAVSLHG